MFRTPSFIFALISAGIAQSVAMAAQADSYVTYAASADVRDALISRNGAVVLTHAVENGDHVLRGWHAQTGEPLGRIEPKKWGEGDFEDVVALSFDGQTVAHIYCAPATGRTTAKDWSDCEELRLYNWSGKTVEKNKHPDDDQVPGPACGLQFGPDGWVYLCTRSLWSSIRGVDDYGTIKVFDPDLEFVYTLNPGYMKTSDPFPGMMQIHGFRVRDDGVNLMGWGYAYHSNGGSPMSGPIDTINRGGQVFWFRLPEPGSPCKGFDCVDRNTSLYHLFGHARPAMKNSPAGETLLLGGAGIVEAVQQPDGHVIIGFKSQYDLETDYPSEVRYRAFDQNTADRTLSAELLTDGGLPPVLSAHALLFMSSRDDGSGWYLPLEKGVRLPIPVGGFEKTYLAEGEAPLSQAFLPGSEDLRLVTSRRIIHLPSPPEQFKKAARLYAKALGLFEVGFADGGLAALRQSFDASPAYWQGTTAPNIYTLVWTYSRTDVALASVPRGRLILQLANAAASMSGSARVGYWYPEGSANIDPPVIDRLTDGNPLLTAGVQKGDIITSIGGIPILWRGDVGPALEHFSPGEKITLGFDRNGTAFTAETVLMANPFTPAAQAMDMWARYAMQALEYGHPDLAEQAATHIRHFIAAKRADGTFTGDRRYESVPDVIEATVLAQRQGSEAGYQALLAADKLESFATGLITSYSRAAFPLYSDLRKLSYVLGQTEDDLKYFIPKGPDTHQPYVDLQGNLVTVGNPPAAQPAEADASSSSTPPSPGGTVLD